MVGGMVLISDKLIPIYYGEQWEPAVIIFQIFLINGIARGIGVSLQPLLIGSGNVKLSSYVKIADSGLFIVLVYFLTNKYGASGQP